MTLPKMGDGFWADVKHDGRNLRVFSEVTEVGEVACVFDLDSKVWINRQWADSLEDGKSRAEAFIKHLLPAAPAIEWRQRK